MQIDISPPHLERATINIDLYPEDEKIAVLFSGGMDSTLLLALLLNEKEKLGLKTEIHCFTASQTGRKFHSTKILDLPFFRGKVIHHTDVPNPAAEGISPMVQNLLDEKWRIYSGANKIPEENIGGRPPLRYYRDPMPEKLHPVFRHLYKYHILHCYYQFNLQHLIAHTSSCTEVVLEKCQECFACKERKWAFLKLGLSPQ